MTKQILTVAIAGLVSAAGLFAAAKTVELKDAKGESIGTAVLSEKAGQGVTIKLNLKQPDSSLLATLTDRAGMMISPTALQKLGADLGHDATGAGTGAFQFVEWVPDDHVLLKRNDAYWNAGAVKVSRAPS